MTNPRILITPRALTARGVENLPSLDPLRERGFDVVSGPAGRLPDEDEQIALLPGVVGWLAGVERITDRVLVATSDLRVIARNGAGADTIDLAAARRLGIEVLTAPGANAQGVAELAFTLALCAVRDVVQSDRVLKQGGWQRTKGREIADVRVGVAGYGAIGRRFAGLFSAVGAEVRFFDPYAAAPFAHERVETLTDLVEWADVVSLHMPPALNGIAVVGVDLLERMRDGTILVNTARSSLVDADAVAQALDDGRLGTYAVDAFDTEPPSLDRLLRHDRTIMTPHLGGFTAASVLRATEAAVSNLITALASS